LEVVLKVIRGKQVNEVCVELILVTLKQET